MSVASSPRLIAVLGMHRSGTSAVTSVVAALGVGLGPSEQLLGASEENPRGYFEHGPAVRLNDDLLRELGGTWDRPPHLWPAWENQLHLGPYRQRAAQILDAAFTDLGVAALKDPRLCLVLPFWQSVHHFSHAVHVIRHPGEVVASLGRRGLSEARSVRLWMRYVAGALSAAPDAHMVFYEDLLDDPLRTSEAMAEALGLAFDGIDGRAIEAAVDVDLRHHSGDPRSADSILGPAVEVYGLLRERGDAAGVEPLLASLSAMHLPSGTGPRTEELEIALAEAEARAHSLVDEAESGRRSAEQLEQLERQWANTQALEQRLATAEREAADARNRLELAEAEARRRTQHDARVSAALLRSEGQLRSEVRTLSRQVVHLQDAHERVRSTLGETTDRLDRIRSERDEARQQADRAAYERDRVLGRRSVRLMLRFTNRLRPVFRIWRVVRRRLGTGASGSASEAVGIAVAQHVSSPVPVRIRGRLAVDGDVIDRLLAAPPVTVVVPVYGAPDEVEACIQSLLRHTSDEVRLVFIDDASPDPSVREVLLRFADHDSVTVLQNETNLGFVRTVNRGMEFAGDHDVVMLNSDTQVTPRWLDRLRLAAYADARTATATPLSDNAGAFSAPAPGPNEYPDHPLDSIAREIARFSTHRRPLAPTGNGFCMYVKRDVINDIGLLDAENFPRGYGEENDFCMRARGFGWNHVIDDATLVRHGLGKSFGDERPALLAAGRATIDRLHPEYTALVREFVESDELRAARESVAAALAAVEADPAERRPRILFTMHGASGGTPLTNKDLMAGIADRYEPFLLRSDGATLWFSAMQDGELVDVESIELARPIAALDHRHDEYRAMVADFVARFDIEIVHVRQLIHHSLDLSDICRAMGVALIVSLHDFYVVCPTTQLLDDKMRFCGGRCTPGQGECFVDFDWLAGLPHLKHSFVHRWREAFGPMLTSADALVTTSASARQVIADAFPAVAERDFRVIEHGRDLVQHDLARAPVPGGPIRIVVPGNINEQKGGQIIRELRSLDEHKRLQFVIMGNVKESLGDLGISLGPYERDEFADIVERIAPAFSAIFSVWAETYSHTLSESWAAGVPVLAFDIGAVGERIRTHGGGWLLDAESPDELYRQILAIADDPAEYERGRAGARASNVRSRAAMADDYATLYGQVEERRRRRDRSTAAAPKT